MTRLAFPVFHYLSLKQFGSIGPYNVSCNVFSRVAISETNVSTQKVCQVGVSAVRFHKSLMVQQIILKKKEVSHEWWESGRQNWQK